MFFGNFSKIKVKEKTKNPSCNISSGKVICGIMGLGFLSSGIYFLKTSDNDFNKSTVGLLLVILGSFSLFINTVDFAIRRIERYCDNNDKEDVMERQSTTKYV